MKKPTRIFLLFAVLTAFLCVAAAYAGNFAIQVTFPPTANGRIISAEDLDGLQEIAVSVKVSADAPKETAFFAPFFDGNGKFVGAGAVAVTADSETALVIAPVGNNVTGAESLKIVVTDADFRPLTAQSYSLTGGSMDVTRENETPILYAFGA